MTAVTLTVEHSIRLWVKDTLTEEEILKHINIAKSTDSDVMIVRKPEIVKAELKQTIKVDE